MPWLSAALAGASFALMGLGYKWAAERPCRPAGFSVAFLLAASALSAARALGEAAPWADPRLWGLGLGMGALLFAALSLLVAANRLGPASVVWTALQLSIVFPLLLGPLFLDEPFRRSDALLLALFALMVAVLRLGSAGPGGAAPAAGRRFWALVAACFAANGLFLCGAKMKDAWFGEAASGALALLFYAGALAFALAAHGRGRDGWRLRPAEWRCGASAGLASGVGMAAQLAAMRMPSALVFPLIQGIALVGGVALTALVFRERITRAKAAGLVLGLAVLLLCLFRERLP